MESAIRLLTLAPPRDAARHQSALEAQVTSLFDEFRAPLLRYLLSCRLSLHDSEEIVQEVFLALFRHLQAQKSQENLRAWLFKVAHNLALKRHNANRSHWVTLDQSDSLLPELHPDPAPNPEEELMHKQRQERLRGIVRALSERERSCLHLRAEGLRYREIAGVLGISLGTVAASLEKALARLQRADGG